MFKKFLLTLVITILMVPVAGLHFEKKVVADSYGYSFSCDKFEIDYINDEGKFEHRACALTLDEAEGKMRELGEDHVVRYVNGKSPTRIVSMLSGIVYAQPTRSSNNKTLSFYQTVSGNSVGGKSTYIENLFSAVYLSTERVITSGSYDGMGMIYASVEGFRGYTDLEYVDLVPSKFLDNNINIWLSKTYTATNSFQLNPVRDYYYIDDDPQGYMNLYFCYSKGSPVSGSTSAKVETLCIGKAFDFMQTGMKYYSEDGVNFYSDPYFKNYVGAGYNYYQFLPLRSKTNVTAQQLDSFLVSKGHGNDSILAGNAQAFIDAQNEFGINALLVYAMAIHESGYGTSPISTTKNNLFGLGAYDNNPGPSSLPFDSIYSCIESQMGYYIAKYCDVEYDVYNGMILGNKNAGVNVKYASDPHWGKKIAGHCYNIARYLGGNDGEHLFEYDTYDLAVVKTYGANFYTEPNTNTVLFDSTFNYNYQTNHTLLVLGEENGFTKVQSPNQINNKSLKHVEKGQLYRYSFDSVAYIKTSDIKYLDNNNNYSKPIGELSLAISEFKVEDNKLIVSGNCYRNNLNEETAVYLLMNNQKIAMDVTNDHGLVSFKVAINLGDYTVGEYKIQIGVEYAVNNKYNATVKIDTANLPNNRVINNKLYSFKKENGFISLVCENAPVENQPLIAIVDLNIEDGKLNIEGAGSIKGLDSAVEGETTHKIVLYDYLTKTNKYEFECEETVSDWFKIDSSNYKYAGFEISIPLNEIETGNYALKMIISNQGVESSSYLMNYALVENVIYKSGDITYNMKSNSTYMYRLELDVEKLPEMIDLSSINKRSTKTSFTVINDISINEGVLSIDGVAMMYAINYNNPTTFNLYLVDNDGQVLQGETRLVPNALDYQTLLNYVYNMDNVSFSYSCDLKEANTGEYRIILETINGQYKDYVELTNVDNETMPAETYNNKTFAINTTTIRSRIALVIE